MNNDNNNITVQNNFTEIEHSLVRIQFLEQLRKTMDQKIRINPDYASVLMYLKKHWHYKYASSMWYQKYPAVIHGLYVLGLVNCNKNTNECYLTQLGKIYVNKIFPHWWDYKLIHRTASLAHGAKEYIKHDKFLIFITAINTAMPPYRDTIFLLFIGLILPILIASLIGIIDPYSRTGVKTYNKITCRFMIRQNKLTTQRTLMNVALSYKQYNHLTPKKATYAIDILNNGMFKRKGCHYNHDEHYLKDYLNQ